jgi:hypothetical protein
MKWKTAILSALILLMSLSACQAVQTADPTQTPLPTATLLPPTPTEVLPTETPSPTPTESPSEETRRTLYHFDLNLNYPAGSLTAIEVIGYTNSTDDALTELPLIVPPARQTGVFSLISLTDTQTQETIPFTFEEQNLTLNLPTPLEPEASLSLTLIFTLQLPEGRQLLGRTDRQLLLTDWYPFIPPYQPGSGWLIQPPGAVGEYLAYPLADHTVKLRLSPPQEGLIAAASVPLAAEDGGKQSYIAAQARNITFAFSPYFIDYNHLSPEVTIRAYVFPNHTPLGQRAADLAAEAWTFYESIYGDNPREYMAIIEADLHDGMEYDGAFLLSEDYFNSADETPQNYYTLLIVHETAHQWFYAQVANDQAAEPWLDEAFATYSELLYLETFHPELVDWWWDYRVNAYQPSGWVDSSIYDHASFRPYVNAVYLCGVQFLDALRQQIGDEAFFNLLKQYAAPTKNDALHTRSDFFSLVTSVSDNDLSDLYAQYFQNTPD